MNDTDYVAKIAELTKENNALKESALKNGALLKSNDESIKDMNNQIVKLQKIIVDNISYAGKPAEKTDITLSEYIEKNAKKENKEVNEYGY